MLRVMYKSKIQKATITETKLEYEGSIGIDAKLMRLAGIIANEKVQVLNFETGARFETYVIAEEPGSGIICLYGPAAHLGKAGQRVFIISYCLLPERSARTLKPKVVYVNEHNVALKKA